MPIYLDTDNDSPIVSWDVIEYGTDSITGLQTRAGQLGQDMFVDLGRLRVALERGDSFRELGIDREMYEEWERQLALLDVARDTQELADFQASQAVLGRVLKEGRLRETGEVETDASADFVLYFEDEDYADAFREKLKETDGQVDDIARVAIRELEEYIAARVNEIPDEADRDYADSTGFQVNYSDGSTYIWLAEVVGDGAIESMIALGQAGDGLNSFIHHNVKYAYSLKVRG